MVKAWLNPGGDLADLNNEVAAKILALENAALSGARFLALPVENIRDACTWILASFHSPVTVVPLPPSLPLPAMEARLAQLPSGTVVFTNSLSLSKPQSQPATLRPLHETWAVIFTSGSSGKPKGIALQGAALKASALAHAEHLGLDDACWLLDLPLYHVGGLSVLSRALFLNSKIAFGPSSFNPAETTTWIQSGLVHGLSLVPTTLFRLLKEERLDLSTLRLILLGGAPAEAKLLQAAAKRGAPIHLTYGMTEHCSQIATEKKPGAGLEPLPGVTLKLAADGEVLVKSSCLASGLYRSGELLPLPKVDGFFSTGDLGEMQNNQLAIIGRKSDLIITGGIKVFPLELESEIAQIPGVLDCAVTSLPDPEWGEMICAVVVENGIEKFEQHQAKQILAQKIDAKKMPKRWAIVSSIPRSHMGKILRSELPKLVGSLKPTHS